ncbi:MAG: toxic anion resistance protein, partial [Rhodobacteraceae bacterium]|nr:toxic anion resistance protein [Paracoccaceae bacterium]
MTDTIRDQAASALAEVEKVTAVILPEPGTALVPLEEASAPQAEEIRKRMAEIDMANTQSIISFGSGAQAELQVISQEMLS